MNVPLFFEGGGGGLVFLGGERADFCIIHYL